MKGINKIQKEEDDEENNEQKQIQKFAVKL